MKLLSEEALKELRDNFILTADWLKFDDFIKALPDAEAAVGEAQESST